MKRVTSQNPQNLQLLEGYTIPRNRDFAFKSVKDALEFYYCGTVGFCRGIDYEYLISKKGLQAASSPSPNLWLDLFATIGYHLEGLGSFNKMILAFFYGAIKTDDAPIAAQMNYEFHTKRFDEHTIREMRIKCLRLLNKKFRSIGIVASRH